MFNLFKNKLKSKREKLNNEERGFIIAINNGKVVHYGENDNIYYPWEFNNEK